MTDEKQSMSASEERQLLLSAMQAVAEDIGGLKAMAEQITQVQREIMRTLADLGKGEALQTQILGQVQKVESQKEVSGPRPASPSPPSIMGRIVELVLTPRMIIVITICLGLLGGLWNFESIQGFLISP